MNSFNSTKQFHTAPQTLTPAEALNNQNLKIPLPSVVELQQQKIQYLLHQQALEKKDEGIC